MLNGPLNLEVNAAVGSAAPHSSGPRRVSSNPVFYRLQMMRGFAALAVAFSHLAHWDALAENDAAREWQVAVGTFSVAIFFVISGFIISHAHREELGVPANFVPYGIKRAFRLYPAYAVFSIVNAVLALTSLRQWDPTGSMTRSPVELVSAVTLLPMAITNSGCAFLGVAWSLFYEMVFYIVFGVSFFGRRLGGVALAVFGGASVLGTVVGLQIFWLSNFSLLFLCGCYLSQNVQRRWPVKVARSALVSGVAAFVCAPVVFERSHFAGRICSAFAAIALVAGTTSLDVQTPLLPKGPIGRTLVWLGTVSYSLYLCHPLVQAVVYGIWGAPSRSFAVAAIYMVAPVFVASISYLSVERPFQSIGRRLIKRLNRLKRVV